ncbi:hypothetical protein CWM47_33500 [Spirosoma pollinicola]|uniref:Uncharacterized protein n=1 Tax=Spirosoma pollinicola TaxID=2057025 RepID=A0A2K8Z930_9BACT|nr:hypothetical protein CWM47_33500 [Spirosoma pollinicola]
MSRLKLLDTAEIRRFDLPPSLTPQQQAHYFTLPSDELCPFRQNYQKIKPLIRYIGELESYIRQNTHLIVDYSERYRYGEAISTGFVESTVNYVVAKRFTKKPRDGGSKCNGVKRGPICCWWCGPKS